MNDDFDASMDDDSFDPVTALAGPLMKKVLNEVALERQKQDGTEGFFRDYLDGTAGRLPMGPTISRERENALEIGRREAAARKTGKLTWRHQLETHAAVVLCEPSEETLRRKLVELAAVSVAWVEAIDRRKDEKRIEKKIHARLPLFERIRQWWKAWRRGRSF